MEEEYSPLLLGTRVMFESVSRRGREENRFDMDFVVPETFSCTGVFPAVALVVAGLS